MKGSQSKKIKAIMQGDYANMVKEDAKKRLSGLLIGGVGGLILGSLLRQNPLAVGLAGAIIGYVLTNNNS